MFLDFLARPITVMRLFSDCSGKQKNRSLTQGGKIIKALNTKVVQFRGSDWWSHETVAVDGEHIIYRSQCIFLFPLFTFAIPGQRINNVELIDPFPGGLPEFATLPIQRN